MFTRVMVREIFQQNKNVFTVSFHGKNNYPFRKEKSDFDYGFSDGVSDYEYLKDNKYEIPRLIEYLARFHILFIWS